MELLKLLRENVNSEQPYYDVPEEVEQEIEPTATLEERLSRVKTLIVEELVGLETDALSAETEEEEKEIVAESMKRLTNIMKLQSNIIGNACVRLENYIREGEEEVIDVAIKEDDIVNDNGDSELVDVSKEKQEEISESVRRILKSCRVLTEGKVFGKSVYTTILESLNEEGQEDVEAQMDEQMDEIEEEDKKEDIEEIYENCTRSITLMESAFGSSVSRKDIKSLCLENYKALKKSLYALREAEEDVEELIDTSEEAIEAGVQESFHVKSLVVFNKRINALMEHVCYFDNLVKRNRDMGTKYIVKKHY